MLVPTNLDQQMNRRNFLIATISTPIVLAFGIHSVANTRQYSLNELVRQLKALSAAQLTSTGQWSVSEIFQHCAQSIQFSRMGYPQAKSAIFQYTAGASALAVFSASGHMTHPLDEPIPGAAKLDTTLPAGDALTMLVNELEHFMVWQHDLAPHFAFGNLNKAQYTAAHYLHVQNHLAEIDFG